MKRDNYFLSITILLLLIVLIGFSPSFYLRSFSNQTPLPFYVILHGISCTAWFIVILLQSFWVKTKRSRLHISYGKYFSLIAPIAFISGLFIIAYTVGKYHIDFQALTPGAEIEEKRSFFSIIILGDLIQLTMYLAFVYLGYRNRSNLNFHKRAMLIASVLMSQQAFVRLGKFEPIMIGDNPGASGGIYATIFPFLIILSLLAYDFIKLKKPHKATLSGIIAYISLLVMAFALKASGLAVQLLESLR